MHAQVSPTSRNKWTTQENHTKPVLISKNTCAHADTKNTQVSRADIATRESYVRLSAPFIWGSFRHYPEIYTTRRQCGFLENNSVCPLKQGSMGIFLCHPRFSRILSMAPLIAMTGWPLGWSPSGIYSFHWLDLCHPTLLQTLPSREFSPKAGQELLPADV